MTEKKKPKKYFFTFPQNWDELTENQQEQYLNQLYSHLIKHLKNSGK
jgi:hypothetical protein